MILLDEWISNSDFFHYTIHQIRNNPLNCLIYSVLLFHMHLLHYFTHKTNLKFGKHDENRNIVHIDARDGLEA